MRSLLLASAVGAVFLASALPGRAADLNLSGTWQIDPAQSQVFDGAATKVVIDQHANEVKFQKWSRERDGQEMESSFSCTVGGPACDFVEGHHHSKVSLWFSGSSLVVLKTDGPRDRTTTERTFTLSPDGKTLTMQFSNVATGGDNRKLVFVQAGSGSAKPAVS